MTQQEIERLNNLVREKTTLEDFFRHGGRFKIKKTTCLIKDIGCAEYTLEVSTDLERKIEALITERLFELGKEIRDL